MEQTGKLTLFCAGILQVLCKQVPTGDKQNSDLCVSWRLQQVQKSHSWTCHRSLDSDPSEQ